MGQTARPLTDATSSLLSHTARAGCHGARSAPFPLVVPVGLTETDRDRTRAPVSQEHGWPERADTSDHRSGASQPWCHRTPPPRSPSLERWHREPYGIPPAKPPRSRAPRHSAQHRGLRAGREHPQGTVQFYPSAFFPPTKRSSLFRQAACAGTPGPPGHRGRRPAMEGCTALPSPPLPAPVRCGARSYGGQTRSR